MKASLKWKRTKTKDVSPQREGGGWSRDNIYNHNNTTYILYTVHKGPWLDSVGNLALSNVEAVSNFLKVYREVTKDVQFLEKKWRSMADMFVQYKMKGSSWHSMSPLTMGWLPSLKQKSNLIIHPVCLLLTNILRTKYTKADILAWGRRSHLSSHKPLINRWHTSAKDLATTIPCSDRLRRS